MWLPLKNKAKVTSPQILGQVNTSVAVLINESTRSWRSDVIDHVFEPAEAAIIKGIPLSSFSQEDKLIWPFTPSGQYTMKSGYRFLYESSSPEQITEEDSVFWKKIWGLQVPNKVKNFIWRACKEALPTKANLYRRKIAQDALCESCKVRSEDGSHSIFFCFGVQVVWRSDPQWSWLSALEGQPMKDIFKYALSEGKDTELLAFMGWAIWNRRNQIRFKEAACPLNHISTLSKERKAEFQGTRPSIPKLIHRNHVRWRPPNTDEMKINYDGAIFSEEGRAGLGVVIRNSEGAVIASLSQQIPLPATVTQVEALAARRATEFAVELGITSAVLEGDSDIVHKELISTDLSLALHGHIIHDVKQLASYFTCIRFVHVRRQGNNVAHALARRAITAPNLNIWMDNVPPDILHVVQADLASFD